MLPSIFDNPSSNKVAVRQLSNFLFLISYLDRHAIQSRPLELANAVTLTRLFLDLITLKACPSIPFEKTKKNSFLKGSYTMKINLLIATILSLAIIITLRSLS
jgi:hypothetical protein